MKLYAVNGQVYFDYTDIDTNEGLGNAIDYRRFMRETSCWNDTVTPQVSSLAYTPSEWETEYGNMCRLRGLLSVCEYQAEQNYVEIDNSFNEFYNDILNRCDELRAIEKAKSEKEKAEAEAKANWQSLCKYGCGDCQNLKYAIDLPICKCTGKPLEEKNKPEYKFGTLQLFNLVPFPSEECPYSSASKAVSV